MAYEVHSLRRPQAFTEISRGCIALHHVFGTDLSKRSNLAFIARNILIYTTGNSVVYEDIVLNTKRYLLAIEDCGIGCVAVHPSKYRPFNLFE